MQPKFAKLLSTNEKFPIKAIHYSTKQVTLQENSKVFNTVGFRSVEFDFSNMSSNEINEFLSNIK